MVLCPLPPRDDRLLRRAGAHWLFYAGGSLKYVDVIKCTSAMISIAWFAILLGTSFVENDRIYFTGDF